MFKTLRVTSHTFPLFHIPLWERLNNGIELWGRHVQAHPGSGLLVYYQHHTHIMQHKCADTLEHTDTKACTHTHTYARIERYRSEQVSNVCRRLTVFGLVPQASTGNYSLTGSCCIMYEELKITVNPVGNCGLVWSQSWLFISHKFWTTE